MPVKQTFTGEEFKNLLRLQFSEACAKGKYKRLPYKAWHYIMIHPDDEDIILRIKVDFNSWDEKPTVEFKFQLYTCEKKFENFYCHNNDGTLGSFLFDYFKEKGETMSYSSSICDAYNVYNTNTISTTSDLAVKGDWSSVNISSAISSDNAKIGDLIVHSITFEDGTTMKTANKENKEKEKKNMMKMFDFGPCDNSKIHMSMYGIAVKNANDVWVSYDSTSGDIIDVDIMNFNSGKLMYKIPVAVKEVNKGDTIIHGNTPMFVKDVLEMNRFLVIDPKAGEEKIIIPIKNMFGFNFMTKVVSFMNFGTATPDTPFGNMFPFLMMEDGKDIDPMMFMAMGNGNFDMSNPMMMYFMMKDKKDNDMLPFLMMMNQKK